MWPTRLRVVQDAAVFVILTLYTSHLAGSISISSSQRSFTRSVQDSVFFSVDVTCSGVPNVQWTFMSSAVSRLIVTWQPLNITEDYSNRVQAFANGSMVLSDLRLQDTGYYVVTITDAAGSSKDAGFVLKVNEVLYEDLHYLLITALALAAMAVLSMLSMWLLHKAYKKMVVWRRRRRMPANDATELQPFEDNPDNNRPETVN
ncbi:V-set and transmembrane domain-containing protein 5 isoform X2 [Betta splendens]|uniref:V-set and transmembrane domain-containing protein 5 isoform X2 n=1 Tax=Betta splendens TaxID=158456 RepID=A0A6P7P311_BETSP|nr:V-set and transmembrane domain-containing protein 5 isoform X2 [Betta splendens]